MSVDKVARRASMVRRASLAGKGRRRSMYSNGDGFDDGFDMDQDEMDLQPPTEVKKVPEGQIQDLTEEQLNEVFTKVITGGDPNVGQSNVGFDYETSEFKVNTVISNVAVHFSMDGDLIDIEGDEARDQEKYVDLIKNRDLLVNETGTSTEDTGDYPEVALSGIITLKNQFNFSERATQTFNNPMRQKGISTEPPPTSEYNSEVTQWDVYDTYLGEVERRIEAASLNEKSKPLGVKKKAGDEGHEVVVQNFQPEISEADEVITPGLSKAMKIMERIVHTNSEAECFQDYKYYEDKSEMKREDGRGSFFAAVAFYVLTSTPQDGVRHRLEPAVYRPLRCGLRELRFH